jgi:hypothetical protein
LKRFARLPPKKSAVPQRTLERSARIEAIRRC